MAKYPIYDAVIKNADEGTFAVSLVTNPATEIGFVVFDEDKPLVKFAVEDEMEHIVSGIIMLADTPIYRRTADNFEYYIKFSKDTLKLMAEKMIFDGVGSSVNIQHEDDSFVDGVNLLELFIIDREKGINPTYFENVPDGSLVGSYKIHNEEVWEMIMKGEVLSFSLEGFFSMVEEEKFYKETYNKNNKENTIKMKVDKVKAMLRKLLAQFGEIATDKGTILWEGDEDLKEGDAVHTVDEEGNDVKVEDGEYRTEDKKIITIQDGKVISIVDEEAEVAPEEEVIEEVVEEIVEDEKDLKIKELEDVIRAKDEEIEILKARIAELEAEPTEKSAEEAFAEIKKEENPMAKRGYRW
jgi:hypothetical protein